MKTPVTITMLLVGGFLIAAPLAFSALHEHEVAATFVARNDLTNINFGDESSSLRSLSSFGCWLTGTGLCLAAIIGAAADARRSTQALTRAPNVAQPQP